MRMVMRLGRRSLSEERPKGGKGLRRLYQPKNSRSVFAVLFAAAIVFLAGGPAAQADPGAHKVEIRTLSTRPDMVSGGDVLVQVDVPSNIRPTHVRVTLNGRDVTDAFRPGQVSGALVGLVEGLSLGRNTLVVKATGRGRGGATAAKLELVNHPITGPIFSGPHQQPFICETEVFGLGPALDKHCSVHTQVEYLYRSTETDAFEPLDPDGPRPGDLAQTTTTEGHTVDYTVRLETGTINRAVYQIAFLHQPGTPLPDPWTTTPGWNGRLGYTFGGGLRAGYHQGRWITGGSSGQPGAGILVEELTAGRALAAGFAMASSTLNVNNTSGNDVISAETAMMVKERFIEQFGVPKHTIGLGTSGGAMQQHLIAYNYPGVLNGIMPGRSFPDQWTFLMPYLDCALIDQAFNTSEETWTTEQKAQVAGHRTYQYCTRNFPNWRTRIHATNGCDPSIPAALIFNPDTNPNGTRCTVQDNQVNIFGTDPATGYARRFLDNVGIQYGLDAFNSGAITFEQFAELNERVGGFDINGNIVPNRMVGDPIALATAYRTGRVNSGAGLDTVPIIDFRHYLDDLGDVHDAARSLIMRARLIASNGHANNQVIITISDERDFAAEYYERVLLMDRWLTGIDNDTSGSSAADKVVRNKPAELVDACYTAADEKITDPAACNQLYPLSENPRLAAGEPLTDDVLKCRLKPVDRWGYVQALTEEQFERLKAIFPEGVCDYSRRGAGQHGVKGTWLSYPLRGGDDKHEEDNHDDGK
jgi:hypothetical protein